MVEMYRMREAALRWSTVDKSGTCPALIAELERYMSEGVDGIDHWGTSYRMRCRVRTFANILHPSFDFDSAGPDKKFGSKDDLRTEPTL